MSEWQKSDWRTKPRVQMPDYTDAAELAAVEGQLSKYPPLVFAGEARKLKRALGAASRGEAFCCRAVIALKALINSAPTPFAIHSK